MKTEWRSPNAIFPMAESDAEFPYSESEDFTLPIDYQPTKYDVINGRGKKSYNHIANRRFRQLTAMNLQRYQKATSKVDKTMIVIGIVNSIRRSSPTGGFIKKDRVSGRWISMSDEGAREKVGHCLRDMSQSQREERRRAAEKKEAEDAHRRRQGVTNPSGEVHRLFHTSTPKGPAFLQQQRVQALSTEQNKGLAFPNSTQAPPRPDFAALSSAYDYPRPGVSLNPHMLAAASLLMPPGVDPAAAMMMSPHFNPYYLGHPGFHQAAAVPTQLSGNTQQIASTFSNLEYDTSNSQLGEAMSDQQQKILTLLENGFRGSVEELIESAGR